MGVLLNMLWDYHVGGYYVSPNAPLRYKARRFLEKQIFPAARKTDLVLGAAAVVLLSAFLSVLEKAGELAEEAMVRLEFLPYREIILRIAQETTWWAREPWKALLAFAIFTIPALAVFGAIIAASFSLVGFFLLAGKAAGKAKAALE